VGNLYGGSKSFIDRKQGVYRRLISWLLPVGNRCLPGSHENCRNLECSQRNQWFGLAPREKKETSLKTTPPSDETEHSPSYPQAGNTQLRVRGLFSDLGVDGWIAEVISMSLTANISH